MVLVLPAYAWVLLGGMVLFAALVVIRMTFDLVGRAKDLARSVKRANGRLSEAVGVVKDEAGNATERLEGIGRRTAAPRRRTH